jgi:hypothetical protein
MKSAAPKQPIGAHLLSPLEWIARSAAWLTNSTPRGGARYVMYGMAGACLLLSAETIYVAMPASPSSVEAGIENRRFLPKPAINDGARLALLNPVPPTVNVLRFAANHTIGYLPFYPRHRYGGAWTVWSDPHWYMALLLNFVVQGIEAKMMRRVANSWEQKQRKFQQLNNRTVPDLNPAAVVSARLAHAELQAEGVGDYLSSAMLILAVYGIEFFAFARAMRGLELSAVVVIVYALTDVFGFEVFWSMAEGPEGE